MFLEGNVANVELPPMVFKASVKLATSKPPTSCFSLKFYDENVWGNLNPCYFDDYAGKTSGIRKFSSKSYDEVFTLINESVESGKIFTVK